jgi:peptidoglycan/xylan/chitin deacetylase (PgdA/CDA1 family)
MKNLNISHRFLKFGEYQRKGHNEKELDPREIKRIDTTDKVVYLTFDMCPTKELATDVIDWLISNKIQATFFVCVDWYKQNQDKDLSFLDNPLFTIGGHGFHHVDPLLQSNDEQSTDITNAVSFWLKEKNKKIEWYRVPHGHPTETTFEKFRELNIKSASWSGPVFDKVVKGLDRKPNELAKFYVENSIQPGDIWIMHANGEGINTFELLKQFTEKIQSQGYSYRKL